MTKGWLLFGTARMHGEQAYICAPGGPGTRTRLEIEDIKGGSQIKLSGAFKFERLQ